MEGRRWVIDVICLLITLAWLASVIADFAIPGYDPPLTVHAIMLAMASALFGSNRLGGTDKA